MNAKIVALLLVLLICTSHFVDGRRSKRSKGRNRRNRNRHKAPRKPKKKSSTEVKDPTSHHIDVVDRNALVSPMESSIEHWTFGGATVVSNSMTRLTPATPDRAGWLWNRHPIESDAWEVEIEMKIYGDDSFGADGLGIWFLHPSMERRMNWDFRGPIFGMDANFRGVGVLLDIYDNDALRNNPLVFALENHFGEDKTYDIENDFTKDMTTTTPKHTPGHEPLRSTAYYKANKCVAEIRNTGRTAKFLIKYVENILHLYVNAKNLHSPAYKFCLAITMKEPLVGSHLALTAATGQLVDNHDILSITTRYLGENGVVEEFDDSLLEELDHEHSTQHRYLPILEPLLLVICALALTGLGGGLLFLIISSKSIQADNLVLPQINVLIIPLYATQAFIFLLLFYFGHTLLWLIHGLILGYYIYRIAIGKHYYDVSSLQLGGLPLDSLPPHWELGVFEVLYAILLVSCLLDLIE